MGNSSWTFFVARRIYSGGLSNGRVSGPAVRVAMGGIAVGLAVMIVSVNVAVGFKHEVHDKVAGLGADISLTHFDARQSYQTAPVAVDDSLLHALEATEGVRRAARYSTKPGMIMTDDDFLGMALKGVAGEYDGSFVDRYLQEGEMPAFSDSVPTNRVLVSRPIADKLCLGTGDTLITYYIGETGVRARRLTVAGIYQTHFSAFDDVFLITDLYTVNRLNDWPAGVASGVEVKVTDDARVEDVKERIRLAMEGSDYYVRTVEESNPQIFAWLDVLDMNVWVILALMTGVAGFTMISGLLILILERTNLIGILKALGAADRSVRKIFLMLAVFLIGRGMLWGNVAGLLLCFVQICFRPFRLDPATYYVSHVPVEFDIWVWLLLNVGTLVVAVLMLVGPSHLVTKIHPARSIRFE